MCLSKVYVDRDGNSQLLMEDIVSVEFGEDKLLLKTLFGQRKEIGANVRVIDFLTHSIFLENLREGSVSPEDK